MELKLKVLDGKHAGQEIAVQASKFFIGRAEDCQIRPASDLISRHHCVLIVDEGYVGVRDLGSKNGTHVNAEPVIGERELKAGDRLKVGPLEFEIVLRTEIGGKKRPAVTGGISEAAKRAATTATVEDADVSKWLSPEPGQAAQAGPHDNQSTQIAAAHHDTTEDVNVGATTEIAIDGAADSQQISQASAETAKLDANPKKPPGKLPFNRIMAKNSRDAAAQVLEMMKKKR